MLSNAWPRLHPILAHLQKPSASPTSVKVSTAGSHLSQESERLLTLHEQLFKNENFDSFEEMWMKLKDSILARDYAIVAGTESYTFLLINSVDSNPTHQASVKREIMNVKTPYKGEMHL